MGVMYMRKGMSILSALVVMGVICCGCGSGTNTRTEQADQQKTEMAQDKIDPSKPYTVEEMRRELASAEKYLAEHPDNFNWMVRKALLEDRIKTNTPISENSILAIIAEARENLAAEQKKQEEIRKKADQERLQANRERDAVIGFCHARNQLLEVLDGKLTRAQAYAYSDKQRYINESYNALVEAQNTLQNISIPQLSKGDASYNMERCLHFLNSSIKWRLQLLQAAQHYLQGNVTQEDYLATQTVPEIVEGDLLNSMDFLVKAASLYGISEQEALNY